MKRCIFIFLLLFCLPALFSCASGQTDEAPEKVSSEETKTEEAKTPYVIGRVIETYEGSCLIEITDVGNQGFALGSTAIVNTSIENCPPYTLGDHLRIFFDGTVALSYPPQILTVFSIDKISV